MVEGAPPDAAGPPLRLVSATTSPERRLAIKSSCDLAPLPRELPALRRAWAAARTAGLELVIAASRAGARRWLRRHRLEDTP